MFPNFIIIGAAKCGTTSLNSYLNQHPDIYMCPKKEPYFFTFMNQRPIFHGPFDQGMDDQIISDINAYQKLFEGWNGERAIGECSNSYLFFNHSSENIYNYIPQCKIVMVLRNPVERTYSHWLQHVMLGHETLSFEEALASEEERKAQGWRWHYQYVAQSMYYEQVKRYFDIFYPKQIYVTFFDDLKRDPKIFVQNVLEFLEVKPTVASIQFEIHNASGLPKNKWLHQLLNHPHWFKEITRPFTSKKLRGKINSLLYKKSYDFKNKPQINPKTYKSLKELFKPDVEKLQNLLQKDLSKWQ